jgi:hypothetical protein
MGSITSFGTSMLFAIVAPIIGAIADRWDARTALIIATLVSVSWIWLYARALGSKEKRTRPIEGV